MNKKKNSFKNDIAPAKKKSKADYDISLKSFYQFLKSEKFHQSLGIFLILISIFLTLSFISYINTWRLDFAIAEGAKAANMMGRLGAYISRYFIEKLFGLSSFLFILIFFVTGVKMLMKKSIYPLWKTYIYSLFMMLWLSATMGLIAENFHEYELANFAGVFGLLTYNTLQPNINDIGIILLLIAFLIVFLILAFNLSFRSKKKAESELEPEEYDETNNEEIKLKEDKNEKLIKEEKDIKKKENKIIKPEPIVQEVELDIEDTEDDITEDEDEDEEESEPIINQSSNIEFTINNSKEVLIEEDESTEPITKDKKHFSIDTLYDPRLDLSTYQFPSTELLDDYGGKEVNVQKEELENNKNRIVSTLNNYGIKIDKIKATIGPTVTLYEIIPAAGVRIAKIKNLEDDIALSLSAEGIRIIAPMPGKGTIGIEVPNMEPEIVSMKSLLASDKFVNSKFELPIALGKTISNECFIVDLAKLPHILMAGATGQGKSVGLNAILTSLLYKKHPSEIKFVLVDPKKVELTLFSKIERHYLAKLPDSEEAIITDTRKVVRTLNSLCIEMDDRYNLLKDAQVRNIKEYNEKFTHRKLNPNDGHRYLPYIILVVDEFADLIMTAGKEVEAPITRLAQLARAIGIHLIIATQRPSVNIITGTIKANFPARIAFRVISKIDSRTILDSKGADQLIGRGDMLLSTGNELLRLQCAFIDIHELERLTSFIGEQKAYPEAFQLPEFYDEADEKSKAEFDSSDQDEYFEEAARLLVQNQHGSTSLIQRKLKLGYNRAGRIIDQLEAAGIIGPFEGSKAREVKIKDEVALEQILQRYRNKEL